MGSDLGFDQSPQQIFGCLPLGSGRAEQPRASSRITDSCSRRSPVVRSGTNAGGAGHDMPSIP
jgi:hypothetical protein